MLVINNFVICFSDVHDLVISLEQIVVISKSVSVPLQISLQFPFSHPFASNISQITSLSVDCPDIFKTRTKTKTRKPF